MSGPTYGSLFSGVEGFGLGLDRAGFRCAWQVEIDAAANRVLAHHYPDVPRHRDIRAVRGGDLEPVDAIIGGFPCQDLSTAGKRIGLAGARSGLFFELTRVVREMREATDGRSPTFLVCENVPGLLSSNGGRDLAVVLGELAQLGPLDIAWTVLDAQWFGVAQRRRRVFLVIDFGGRRAGEVLALAEGLSGDPPPRREAREGVAASLTAGSRSGCGVNAPGRRREDDVNLVIAIQEGADTREKGRGGLGVEVGAPMYTLDTAGSHAIAAFGAGDSRGERDISAALTAKGGTGRHDFESELFVIQDGVDLESKGQGGLGIMAAETMYTLDTAGKHAVAKPLLARGGAGRNNAGDESFVVAHTLSAEGHDASEDGTGRGTPLVGAHIAKGDRGVMAVRRLTPLECCRLQGLPDDWLDLDPPLADSAKYRLLGNAVCCAVSTWLGRRLMDALTTREEISS
ncbi:MAG TPA: DNA (cytosine-5-)-methyltransferase [Thermomicrobiales bacterium]|nr:DNA (cytosine-5-)-methyltransferase [Thermomicrobiales bacterium]